MGFFEDAGGQILVACDGRSRIGREARFSILFDKKIIKEAQKKGWSAYESSSGEEIFAFKPPLFPTFLDLLSVESPVSANNPIQDIVAASGMLENAAETAEERARRAAHVLVRNQAFSNLVRTAYNHACAMCGIGLKLVVGAHIYPVNAPDSPDIVQNGLCLCNNHHAMFDAHKIWIDPGDYKIKIHPEVLETCTHDGFAKAFIDSTFEELAMPVADELRPSKEMLERRYDFYNEKYGWLN